MPTDPLSTNPGASAASADNVVASAPIFWPVSAEVRNTLASVNDAPDPNWRRAAANIVHRIGDSAGASGVLEPDDVASAAGGAVATTLTAAVCAEVVPTCFATGSTLATTVDAERCEAGTRLALAPDDVVVVCLSLRDDVPAPNFDSDDDVEQPEPLQLLVFKGGAGRDFEPPSDLLLDELPELEPSACAMPAPPASVIPTPRATAPTPNHPYDSRWVRLARWAPFVRCLDAEALTC